jgi:thiol-disulfide isomerase/thioredoxin
MVTLLVCSAVAFGCADGESPVTSADSEKASSASTESKGDEKTDVANLNLEEPSEMVEDSTELVIGDSAPMIAISKWINGEPVTEYAPERVYVIEFWATWCGPCLKSMPHIASLQEEYGDSLTVVGVTAEDDATVSEFMTNLAGQGDKTWRDVLTYRIATDDDGKTNKLFMEASGQAGIPCAFIVGKTRNIEWIGHPMEIDGPLKQIVEGSWDSALAKKTALETKALEKALRTVGPKIDEAMAAGDVAGAIVILDGMLQQFPGNSTLLKTRFKIAMQVPLFDEANKSAKMMADVAGQNVRILDDVAWMLATATDKPGLDLDLALSTIQRAVELTKEQDVSVLETIARVHSRCGNGAEAVDFQTKAVEAAKDPDQKQRLTLGLEKYKSAAKKSVKETNKEAKP